MMEENSTFWLWKPKNKRVDQGDKVPRTSSHNLGSCPSPQASFSSSLKTLLGTWGSPWSEFLPTSSRIISSLKAHSLFTYKKESIPNPQNGHCLYHIQSFTFYFFYLKYLFPPSTTRPLPTAFIFTYPAECGADTFQTYMVGTSSLSTHDFPSTANAAITKHNNLSGLQQLLSQGV